MRGTAKVPAHGGVVYSSSWPSVADVVYELRPDGKSNERRNEFFLDDWMMRA